MRMEIRINRWLNRKELKGVNVTEKQKEEVMKVLEFLNSKENENESILKKQNTNKILCKMVIAGVDNLYLRRLLRHKKYSFLKVTLYGMIILYSRKGYEYWENYCQRQSYTNTYEYKNKKYGWDKEKFDEYNKSRSVTLENCIKRHGEKKGKKLFEDYCQRQSYTNTYEYLIEKYNGDEKRALSEFQRINSQKGITFENLMRKYGDRDKVIEMLQKKNVNHSFTSLISKELFDNIYERLPPHLQKKTYYGHKNEFGKFSKDRNKYYFYDFVISNIKFCIEFNGDI